VNHIIAANTRPPLLMSFWMAKMASISKDDRKATRRKVRKAMLDASKKLRGLSVPIT
jgi:hypothetical protein